MTEPHLEHSIFGAEEHEGRAARRRAARRPRRRRGRRLIVLVLALAIVGGAVYAAYGVLRPVVAELTASNDFPARVQERCRSPSMPATPAAPSA